MSSVFLRLLLVFVGSLLVTLLVGRPFLFALRRLRLGQNIRPEGPQSHQKKAGTPTMGGVIILTGVSISLLATGMVRGDLAWGLMITLGFGLLGLVDDVLSVAARRNMGLKARHKLLGQIILACALGYFVAHGGGDLPIPFVSGSLHLGSILLFALSAFAMVSMANGVNLTDGLDGLAAGTVSVAAVVQTVLVMLYGRADLALLPAAVAGACLGFLWFNAHPASVFMGDTGSLALGGALGATAVLSGTTLFLPVISGVFVCELLSVILQIVFYQTMGRRIFRMSPLHHHFELGGWPEEKVVVRFYLMSLLFGLVGLFGAWPVLLGGR